MINEYVEYCRHNKGLSDGTCREVAKDLRAFVTWMTASGIARWRDVTRRDVESYVTELSKDGYKAATIRKRVSTVRQAYQFAWQQGWTHDNPAMYVSTPKLGAQLPKTVPVDDIRATVEDMTVDLETRAIIALMTETGMRISEARGVRAVDIDTRQQSVTVRGKGDKERTVYYGAKTAAMLEAMGTMAGELFTKSDRETRYNVHCALMKHSDTGKCTPHALRHTYATSMVEAGVDVAMIAELMGHNSIETTKRYLHMGTAAKQAATQKGAPMI